jgi:serine/threonine-protein kinase RsbW
LEERFMPDVPAGSETMSYAVPDDLSTVRAFVRSRALALGLAGPRADLLMLAVSELATNTLQHTSGGGRVRVWSDGSQLVCDVADGGTPPAPGRPMPPPESVRGRGLPIVDRVSDQVVTSVGPDGAVVRLRLNL